MKVAKINKSGKDVYRVYIGQDPVSGKKQYKQFATKMGANDWIRHETLRRQNHGHLTANLDGALVSTWSRLDAELNLLGTSLADIGKAAHARLSRIKKTGSAVDCLDEFLAVKKSELKRPLYLQKLRRNCLVYAETLGVGAAMSAICKDGLAEYLTNIPGGHSNLKNHRCCLGAWLRWAAKTGWLGEDPMPPRLGSNKKIVSGEAAILSPADVAQLLRLIVDSEDWDILAYFVLTTFAGIRPQAEMRKPIFLSTGKRSTIKLKYEDITPKGIAISANLSKTGSPRMIPMQPVLQSWMEFIRTKKGILAGGVVPPLYRRDWTAWRKKHWPHKWHNDQLRHTYGSYRLAQTKNSGQVSLEMGNTPVILLKHYWRWETLDSDADIFWNLYPEKIVNNTFNSINKKIS